MTKKQSPIPKDSDQQNYSAVGLVFLLVGLGLAIPDNTRVTGIPFLVLGLTFMILGRQTPKSKTKK